MRRALPLFLASLLLIALAAPVGATTPVDERRVRTDVPLGTYDIVLPPAEACDGFDLAVEDIAGKITEVFITEDRHGNVHTRTIFHTITRFTNLETGEYFDSRFDSVGTYTLYTDGTLKVIGRNDALLWGPEPIALGLDKGLWFFDKSRMVLWYGADGSFISAEVQEGEAFNVCDRLS